MTVLIVCLTTSNQKCLNLYPEWRHQRHKKFSFLHMLPPPPDSPPPLPQLHLLGIVPHAPDNGNNSSQPHDKSTCEDCVDFMIHK